MRSASRLPASSQLISVDIVVISPFSKISRDFKALSWPGTETLIDDQHHSPSLLDLAGGGRR